MSHATNREGFGTSWNDGADGQTPSLRFSVGVIGFEEHRRFFWDSPADERLTRFRVLRNVEDPALVFLVLPLADSPELRAEREMTQACSSYGLQPQDCAWYAIVTPTLIDNEIQTTANLRAPLLLDRNSNAGRQVVLESETLPFRHPI